MATLRLDAMERLARLSPGDLDRRKRSKGNKKVFLKAAFGTLSEEEANELQRIIKESCERID